MPDLSIIPARALDCKKDGKITDGDIVVLCAIGYHTDGRDGSGCFARARTMYERAGVSRSAWFASTKRLLEAGLIERSSGQLDGVPSEYSIVVPVKKTGVRPDGLRSSPSGTGESSSVDSPTINAPINAASSAFRYSWNGFTEDETDAIDRVLARVPHSGRRAWVAEINAMLSGMAGHVHATRSGIAKGFHDLAGNGKAEEPNLRQFRRYVRDAMEAEKATSTDAALEEARNFWRIVVRRGVLFATTKEIVFEAFRDEYGGNSDLANEALELFLSLDRHKLQTPGLQAGVAVNIIADAIAKRSRSASLTNGEHNVRATKGTESRDG